MKPQLNVLAIVNIVGAVQCLLISPALFTIKSGNRAANRFLGIFLFLLSFYIIDLVIFDTGFYITFPHLWGVGIVLTILLPPFFFFYIKSLINPQFKFKLKDCRHFILFVLVVLLNLEDFFWHPDLKRMAYYAATTFLPKMESVPAGVIIESVIASLVVITYLIASLILLNRNLDEKGEILTKRAKANFIWNRKLIVGLLVIVSVSTAFDFFPIGLKLQINITPFTLTLLVYSMVFTGIRHSKIFTTNTDILEEKKYKKSILTTSRSQDILNQLEHLMIREKLYMDNNMTMPKLAKRLAITPHHLSQVLNESVNLNFFNFINGYRINEAQKKLVEPNADDHSILDIAYSVGFNSLSAFNAAFKKHTAMTPTQFKKKKEQ